MADEKKIIFSGVQPTGCVTLGNYLGALKNWAGLQYDYHCCFAVMDMHAITVRQDPAVLRRRSIEFLVQYMACGIDAEENLLFFQSHVPTHAELAWVLDCNTYMGELSRMTQFKDKSAKHADNINAGLFTYPSLMAADILLYQTDLVPVGSDQKQHLELARDLAVRFNHYYGETFKVPDAFIPKEGARIMSLQDPTAKMSKSDPNENGFISILDTPEAIMRKCKRAVTDSDSEIAARGDKPGVTNLLNIYAAVTGTTVAGAEHEFSGKGYGAFKQAVGEAVVETLRPVRERYDKLIKDKAYIESVYKHGAERAYAISNRTLQKVYRKVGFVNR